MKIIVESANAQVLLVTAEELRIDDVIKGYGRVHEIRKRPGYVEFSLRRGFCSRSVASSTEYTVSRQK